MTAWCHVMNLHYERITEYKRQTSVVYNHVFLEER